MEFKVFKNENSKILKEYWLTQSEWDALDKTTVQEGDIYHIVGTIDKGDLSADVNASLAKGDSSLQKPTATLAKESFVKVGIDGTQKFDESSYVVAPSTDGTAGQVLKKTATGTEWANESGKLYKHHITFDVYSVNEQYPKIDGIIFIDIYSSSSTAITLNTIPQLENYNAYIAWLYNPGYGTQGVVGVIFNKTHNEIEVYGAGNSSSNQFQSLYYLFAYNDVTRFVDTVTEL